jgi:hypothetical protein
MRTVTLRFSLKKYGKEKNKIQCVPVIQITQHLDSLIVLNEIKNFLGFGSLKFRNTNAAADILIRNLKETNQFIAKFKEADLYGAKLLMNRLFVKV